MPKPTVIATIDPIGARGADGRQHLLKINVPLDEEAPGPTAQHDRAVRLVLEALEAFAPGPGERDQRAVRDVVARRKGKAGAVFDVVVGIEASVISAGRPADDVIAALRATLLPDYHVVVRERRECAQGVCGTEAVLEWDRPDEIPQRWFSNSCCGKHDFTACRKCKSVYRLTSINAAGQASAVHCEVCGQVLVEWGSSKVWMAELVTRHEPPAGSSSRP